jgi:signal transduction histidine kinase
VIAPEDQRRIFDPFEILRSDRSDREGKTGIGLGLYIAEQIAVAHGGSVGVRSSVGEGTTFQLRLPRLVAA